METAPINSEGNNGQEIIQRAEKYIKKVKDELKTGSSDSMRHILNNQASMLSANIYIFNKRGIFSTDDAEKAMKIIDDYFDLLEKYPQFKEGEKAGKRGYFHDRGINLMTVEDYRRELEKEFPELKNSKK
jgi:hypothetical protein